MFAFTSLGVDIDRLINTGRGPYIFRINGVVHHRIGSLIPEEGNRPQYAQLYIYDAENEVQNRLAIHSSDPAGDSAADARIVESLIATNDYFYDIMQEKNHQTAPRPPCSERALQQDHTWHGCCL